jgi:hypothetical protein
MIQSRTIQKLDANNARVLARFRFVSASRIARPLMEPLESRYFFAAHLATPPSPTAALPAPPPVPPLFTAAASPAPTPVANIVGQVQAPVASPSTEQGDLSALLENDTGFTLIGNHTNDSLFGGQSNVDIVASH